MDQNDLILKSLFLQDTHAHSQCYLSIESSYVFCYFVDSGRGRNYVPFKEQDVARAITTAIEPLSSLTFKLHRQQWRGFLYRQWAAIWDRNPYIRSPWFLTGSNHVILLTWKDTLDYIVHKISMSQDHLL